MFLFSSSVLLNKVVEQKIIRYSDKTFEYKFACFTSFALDVSLLSYPVFKEQTLINNLIRELLVEPSGIEPLTSCLQGRRSPS